MKTSSNDVRFTAISSRDLIDSRGNALTGTLGLTDEIVSFWTMPSFGDLGDAGSIESNDRLIATSLLTRVLSGLGTVPGGAIISKLTGTEADCCIGAVSGTGEVTRPNIECRNERGLEGGIKLVVIEGGELAASVEAVINLERGPSWVW